MRHTALFRFVPPALALRKQAGKIYKGLDELDLQFQKREKRSK